MPTIDAKLTRMRMEAAAPTEKGLRDYLTKAMEDAIRMFGPGWHQPQPITVQTTRTGYWGYVILLRNGVDDKKETT